MAECCTYCNEPVREDNKFVLDHTLGVYGEDTEPTVHREGVFCSSGCLRNWVILYLDKEAE